MKLSFSTRGWPGLSWEEMLDTAADMGSILVPSPAAGIIAFLIFFIASSVFNVIED